MIYDGPKFVYGVPQAGAMLLLRGFPEGAKIRLRFRINELALAFVFTESKFQVFELKIVEGFWEPGLRRAYSKRNA